MTRGWPELALLGWLGVLAACDAPSDPDAEVRLAPADAVAVVAPAAADELALTGGEADDLFPALHGDDLVWVRVDVDQSVLGPDAEPPDCLTCTWCEACRWRVMHRRLSELDERALWTGHMVRSAPTVHEGLAAFVDGDGILRLVDVAHGVTERIPQTGYIGRAPRVHEAIVWWLGWRDAGMYILAWDVTVPGFVTELRADVTERWWVAGGLGGIGRPQPFALDGEHVLWTAGNTEGRVERMRLSDGQRTTVVVDPERIHFAPLVVNGAIVTLSYAIADGCNEGACDLALARIDPGTGTGDASGVVTPLAEGAAPTLYVSPVGDDQRVVWVDKRAGAYMLVGLDLRTGGVERRLSSDEARVGVTSPPAIDDGRVVWSDRRSGRWQLVMRDW